MVRFETFGRRARRQPNLSRYRRPTGILRQLGAYRDALRLIYPARRVQAAVLWTRTRSLMWLPDPLLDGVMAALDPAGGRP